MEIKKIDGHLFKSLVLNGAENLREYLNIFINEILKDNYKI